MTLELWSMTLGLNWPKPRLGAHATNSNIDKCHQIDKIKASTRLHSCGTSAIYIERTQWESDDRQTASHEVLSYRGRTHIRDRASIDHRWILISRPSSRAKSFHTLENQKPVHTIDNEIQSSPWLIKPISGVMKMDKHREGIKSNRPCGENQNCSSVKITIKAHEQNYNNNTRWTRVLLTRSTRLRGVTRNTILSMGVRESSSYMLWEGDEITKSTTRLKLKKEQQKLSTTTTRIQTIRQVP